MAWQKDRSSERVQKHLDNMGEIDVSKLTREADLEKLLSETCCRQIYGTHIYVPVSNFTKLVSDEPDGDECYKELIQALNIYQREVSRIVEWDSIFGGVRVHFQGAKLHALFYRPIDAAEKLATKATMLQLVLRDFVKNVFNPAFPDFDDFQIAGGADIGDAIGTRNGMRDNRELLFLGRPANYAAKIVSNFGRLRLTEELYDELPEDLQDLCTETEGVYQLAAITQKQLDELTKKYEIGWDRDLSAGRIEDDKEQFPLSVIAYSSADTKINLDELSIRNNKRVLAATVFGDITGFTDYIDGAATEAARKKALKNFHVIRREMARVIKNDFDGLHVQFQGDRVQGLLHLPKDDEKQIATDSTDAAVGLQSSMEEVLRQKLSGIENLKMAGGVDQDTTLASKTGTRGHRDRLCVGDSVEEAARCEETCSGGETGITKTIYDLLPDRLKQHFEWNKVKRCYVADGLTTATVEAASRASSVYAGAAVYVRSDAGGARVSSEAGSNARKIVPGKSYAS